MAKKNDAPEREDTELLDESSGPRVYELGFHLDPELPSEELKKAYGAVRSAVEKNATLVAEGEPTKVQLAYTISRQETSGRHDFSTSYFSWIAYECDSTKHAEIMEVVKADTRIFRFLDIITDRDAARHAAELQEIALKAPEHREEGVSDAELDAAIEEAVPAAAAS